MVWVTDTAQIWHFYGCGVGWQLEAPIQPLAWELPYAVGAALQKTKKKKNSRKKWNIVTKDEKMLRWREIFRAHDLR